MIPVEVVRFEPELDERRTQAAVVSKPHPFRRHPWIAVAVTAAGFFIVSRGVGLGAHAIAPGQAWLPQVAVKGALIAAVAIAAWASGQSARELGLRWPTAPARWLRSSVAGLLLGSAATVVMLAAGSHGLRSLMQGQSFLQIVLGIWLLSSAAEELFCRGWFQAALLGGDHAKASIPALLPSAVLFGSLHLGLLVAGVDPLTVVLLLPFVTGLGLLTAWARARTGSLVPAIVVHVAFNVGGVLGGIVFMVCAAIATGHVPV